MENNRTQFKMGVKHGIPIALGYLAVSFSFGIMARGAGIGIWFHFRLVLWPEEPELEFCRRLLCRLRM